MMGWDGWDGMMGSNRELEHIEGAVDGGIETVASGNQDIQEV